MPSALLPHFSVCESGFLQQGTRSLQRQTMTSTCCKVASEVYLSMIDSLAKSEEMLLTALLLLFKVCGWAVHFTGNESPVKMVDE